MVSILELSLLALTGFGTGILGALLGIGGGTLLIPIMVLLFHIPIHLAISASLLSVIATSCASSSVFLGKGLTNMRLGMTLEMFTTIGGIAGALISIAISEAILKLIFSGMVFLTAFAMLKRPTKAFNLVSDKGYLGAEYRDEELKQIISYRVKNLSLGCFISFFAGTVSGLLGIGGGIIKVPTMVLGMKVPLRAASATSDMMIGVTAAASFFIFYANHQFDLFISSSIAVGTFCGSLLGAHLVSKLHSRALRIIFSSILFLTAIEMILRASGIFK